MPDAHVQSPSGVATNEAGHSGAPMHALRSANHACPGQQQLPAVSPLRTRPSVHAGGSAGVVTGGLPPRRMTFAGRQFCAGQQPLESRAAAAQVRQQRCACADSGDTTMATAIRAPTMPDPSFNTGIRPPMYARKGPFPSKRALDEQWPRFIPVGAGFSVLTRRILRTSSSPRRPRRASSRESPIRRTRSPPGVPLGPST